MRHYFEGWYFKQQINGNGIAFIPALHMKDNDRSASLQVVLPERSFHLTYPKDAIQIINRKEPAIELGDNHFSSEGIRININTDELKAQGKLNFGPFNEIRYDVMGPFKFIPFMECRHSVFSMKHDVAGSLKVNGIPMDFSNGTGYIEGDRGRSFPKQYFWTQCFFTEGSLMLAVADIPFLNGSFTGIIGIIMYRGAEYRMATYLGARAECIQKENILIHQGNQTLTVHLLEESGEILKAPFLGAMNRIIRENISCKVHYRFEKGNGLLFDFSSDLASFEYEYH